MRALITAFSLVAALTATPVLAGDTAADNAVEILNTASYWRCWITLRDIVFGTREKPEGPGPQATMYFNSPEPPAGWRGADFGDGDWMRLAGPVLPGAGYGSPRQVSVICLRGTFQVNDPAAVAGDLSLSAVFRGGIVVCLNGREVVRKFLPAGELTPDSLADDYPPEAFFTPEGRPIRGGFGEPEKYKDRLGLRLRKTENVSIPAGLLRKGQNVLAVEIHRTANPVRKTTDRWEYSGLAGLNSLSLSAADSGHAAIVPNVARPAGAHLSTLNILQAVSASDYCEAEDRAEPIRLVGAANGTYSGQLIVSAEGPVTGVTATPGDLKCEAGGATIPASAVQVR